MTHTQPATASNTPTTLTASRRAQALADRLEQGARELAAFAAGLTDAQWQTRVPHDGRTVGITVHHVANMYPLEVQLAQQLAAGNPIAGVSWDDVHVINASHAAENENVTLQQALELLRTNSTAAAAAIRSLTDAELDQAATISLYGDAPLTCQFFIEDHAMRHSFHHLARMRRAVEL
jgi:hypothetical protein